MCGRGKGQLPHEGSLFQLEGRHVSVTCVKQAEDGDGLIIRLVNLSGEDCPVRLMFSQTVRSALLCGMDETAVERLPVEARFVSLVMAAKKIRTVRVLLER
jgi:mannosylglycerate hydrolase